MFSHWSISITSIISGTTSNIFFFNTIQIQRNHFFKTVSLLTNTPTNPSKFTNLNFQIFTSFYRGIFKSHFPIFQVFGRGGSKISLRYSRNFYIFYPICPLHMSVQIPNKSSKFTDLNFQIFTSFYRYIQIIFSKILTFWEWWL